MRKFPYFKPMLAAFVVYAIWGFSFLASKLCQTAASPFVVLMYRFDIASLIMSLPWMLGKRKIRLKGKNLKGLLGLGLCEPVVYFVGEQYGLKYTNSAFSGVMIAIIPIVTLIMTAVFLKEKPTPLQWFFSLLSIAGVIAITLIAGGSGGIRLLGVALLILAVISGSAYNVISRGISDSFTVYERTLVIQLMGAAFYTLLAIMENREDFSALIAPLTSGDFVPAILYLSLAASVAGYSLLNYAVTHAPMANATSLCNLTTVLSVSVGATVLHEPFSVGSAIALAVILIGIWGVQKTGPRAAEAVPAAVTESGAQAPGSVT